MYTLSSLLNQPPHLIYPFRLYNRFESGGILGYDSTLLCPLFKQHTHPVNWSVTYVGPPAITHYGKHVTK